MLGLAHRLRRLLTRKELLSVFVMIFIADVVTGVFSPTFSLYAASLGASLTLVGLLSSTVGLTRILSSVPIGMISDSRGRKGVLVTGMGFLAVMAYLCTVVTNPVLLFPMRMLYGLMITSTFFIGMAYVGDLVIAADRGLASGAYTTCMGLGFTVGSVAGGKMAASLGYVATYRLAAGLALVGVVIAWWGLAAPKVREVAHVRVLAPGRLGLLIRDPQLLAVSLGYTVTILIFDAAIANFLPLYANSLLISQAAIGSMFAFRALASTAARLPTGILTARFPIRRLMTIGLCLGTTSVFAICFLTEPVPLAIALAGEGIGFGMFLVSGAAFINGHFPESDRGTAMGIYSMTGSIAATVGPFVLGAVADEWGLRAVFWLAGAIALVGIVVFLTVGSRRR